MGRPALWGLAHSGQKGVERILDILKMEFDSTMAVCGKKLYFVIVIIAEITKLTINYRLFVCS